LRGDARELTVGPACFTNPPGTLCHLNSDLQLQVALPEWSVPGGTRVISRGQASRARSWLIADYRAAAVGAQLDATDFRAFLVVTPQIGGPVN
jgi:hypothetical protein